MSDDTGISEFASDVPVQPESGDDAQMRLALSHLFLRECLICGFEDEDGDDAAKIGWNALFRIEQQSFFITPDYRDTQEEAIWFARMFAKALCKFSAESEAAQ